MANQFLSTEVTKEPGPPAEPREARRRRAADTPPNGVLALGASGNFGDAQPGHLRDYLWVLYKHRGLVATCLGATLALTILVTLFMPRRYTAATRIQLTNRSQIQLQLKDSVVHLDDPEVNGQGGAVSFVTTQVAALQSRDLADRVIRSHELTTNEAFLHPRPSHRGLLTTAGKVFAPLRPRGWATPADGTPSVDAIGDAPIDPELFDRYMDYLSVKDVAGTDVVEVKFTTPNPELSAFLAAAHTQAFMEANEAARRATDALAREFLERQLNEALERVSRADAAMRRFAAAHPRVAVNEEQQIIAQRIGELSSELTKAEGGLVALESRYQFLAGGKNNPLTYLLDRPGIQKLRLALLDVRAQRGALGQELGPHHPQMEELTKLEAEFTRELNAEVAQEVAAVGSHYSAAKLRAERLRRKLAREERTGIRLRDLGSRYDILKSEVDTAHNLHASLLKQHVDTTVNAELAAANVRVVERPEIPRWPSRPKIPLNMALGLTAGLVIAVGAAFGREYFDTTVRSSEEMEGLLQLPTLATIPNFAIARNASRGMAGGARPRRSAADQSPWTSVARAALGNGNGAAHRDGENGAHPAHELVVLHEPWSSVAESFRGMRAAVLFSAPDDPPRVALVTSALAAEGKTVASLNLAAALAESGSRVVLVDADLRHPRCHTALRVANDPGLSTFLAGHVDLESVVYRLDRSRLFLVPAGPPPPNPAELVSSPRMRRALAELRQEYDFVILDTPPVLPATDAIVLAREVDGVVLVVKGHDTPRELVRRAYDRLTLAGARFLGVVVNNVNPRWGDYYYTSASTSGPLTPGSRHDPPAAPTVVE